MRFDWCFILFLVFCGFFDSVSAHGDGFSVGFGIDCSICKFVIGEAEAWFHESKTTNETLFHAKLDELCYDAVAYLEWPADYCMYEMDYNALEIYNAVVQNGNTTDLCTWLGYCGQNSSARSPFSMAKTRTHRHDALAERSVLTSLDALLADAANPNWYTIVQISDTHIGQGFETQLAVWLLQQTVNKINMFASALRVKLVLVTGDVTDSALPSQFYQARQLLDLLTVPYLPLIGNHDMQAYTQKPPRTNQEPQPHGDLRFAATFADIFNQSKPGALPADASLFYSPAPGFDATNNVTVLAQNWELRMDGLIVWALDFNSRAEALQGDPGCWPAADLLDFENGTLPWLRARVAAFDERSDAGKTIILAHHHPYGMPGGDLPGWIFSFSDDQLDQLKAVLMEKPAVYKQVWGVLAGHLHVWNEEPSTRLGAHVRQWLVEAVKVGSALSFIKVENGTNITAITRTYGFDF